LLVEYFRRFHFRLLSELPEGASEKA